MRKTCIDMVYELAKKDPRVVFVGSDLSPGLLDNMKKDMPQRHYMEGIAEANVMGMAAGMALDGYMPFVNTIATFITRRAYEQVAVDLCLHHLPVRLIGNGGGMVYAPLGPTHLAIEDIATMRALPNMTVTAVCDAEEMKRLMWATLDHKDAIYIRLGKGGDKVVSEEKHGFEIGKAILLKDSSAEDAVLLVTCGVTTQRALEAAEALEKDGIPTRVLHNHTLKPFDKNQCLELASKSRLVVTVEEHLLTGGLGSIVAECCMDEGVFPAFKRLGIPDIFPEHYGRQESLMEHFGFDTDGIIRQVKQTLAEKKNSVSKAA